MSTTSHTDKARAVMAQMTSKQLVEAYLKVFDVVGKGDTERHLAAAQVREWTSDELERRGDLAELTAALGCCDVCWANDRSHAGKCADCHKHGL